MILIALLAALAAFVFAVAMTRRGSQLNWRQWHHAYLGWALVLAGAVLGSRLIATAGLVVSWDDSVQHALQNVRGWSERRLSLLAWLLWDLTLSHWGPTRALDAWLDRTLGKVDT